LLGVFLLGLLTTRVHENAAIIAMLAGLGTMLYVKQFTHVAFTWYVLIGTAATFLAGFAASLVLKEADDRSQS
jgi:SSS family solute:Na+ symporter